MRKLIVGIVVLVIITAFYHLTPNEDYFLCVNGYTSVTSFSLTSPAFSNGSYIPDRYACEGININPELHINNTPAGTQSLALIMDDPDAVAVAGYTWIHWLLWNIAPSTKVIQQNSVPANAIQGRNSWGNADYGGPCPPEGRDHLYFFKFYALDINLTMPSTDAGSLMAAMNGHIIEQAVLTGRYSKGGPPAPTPTSTFTISIISSSTISTTSSDQTTPATELSTLLGSFAFIFTWSKKK
ncbi:MAG: YbhB/YbcL family Raf kinase inhibitor-like protein [Candidatus Hodarchaeota archaeon]